jgi:hypothetical protein
MARAYATGRIEARPEIRRRSGGDPAFRPDTPAVRNHRVRQRLRLMMEWR